jgi:hypothetical protein
MIDDDDDDDDFKIDWDKLSPTTRAVIEAIAEQRGMVLDTSEAGSVITPKAKIKIRAEAQKRGVSIYEVIDTVFRKPIA